MDLLENDYRTSRFMELGQKEGFSEKHLTRALADGKVLLSCSKVHVVSLIPRRLPGASGIFIHRCPQKKWLGPDDGGQVGLKQTPEYTQLF